MVDVDAAIGYVVAHGDAVDRARLAWLRSGIAPPPDVLDKVELGSTFGGGWPAFWGGDVASVDATCFRLGELDDLGALERPAARRALAWLASTQQPDGMWEEDASLAAVAPPWARPGNEEARLYLTTNAAFWLVVGGPSDEERKAEQVAAQESAYDNYGGYGAGRDTSEHTTRIVRAAEAFRAALRPDGSWPSFLVTGWLGGAVLYHLGWFYESAQIQVALAERVPDMTAGDTASLYAAMRRIGMSDEDSLLRAARRRLSETQRSDGAWESDDGDQFNVHTTLKALRALRTVT